MRRIRIFDTTLRDGEQSPGCSMNLHEKLEMAARLEALRVDVIEAGFAASSPGDLESVREIASAVKDCSVASLARSNEKDIDKAWEALRPAQNPCIHIFIATSPIHMTHKLKKSPEEVLELAVASVAYAKRLCPGIEFSAEDASRSDWKFLARVFSEVIRAGATSINVPDTVGYATPQEMAGLIAYLKEHVYGIETVELSVHCHNDLGMAVANSLAAVLSGATQVECALNGIGERAGNAALEEVVAALRTKREFFRADTGVELRRIYRASRTLSSIIGVSPSPTKPIVGDNAFAHEAGIHQHGMLASPLTYEIINPRDIGVPSAAIVLGKHSGRHAFEDRLRELGFELDRDELEGAFEQFKALADRKKTVTDDDIIALIGDKSRETGDGWRIVRFVVNSGSTIPATAAIKLELSGAEREEASTGDGPVNAVFNAIDLIVGNDFILESFSVRSVTEGEDALGEAVVKLRRGDALVTGRGLSTDIIEASIKAYLNGVNKLLRHMG